MIKPRIEQPLIIEVLNNYFGQPVKRLSPIGTGQIASAFSFEVEGQSYIVRFVTDNVSQSFGKDQFVSQRLASSSVPVPPILHRGRLGDIHYAISSRVSGTPLDQLSNEDYRKAIPSIIETLDAIRQVDVSDTASYGDFDAEGKGGFPSWPEFLLNISEEDEEGSFYGRWHWMFDGTFVEKEFFDYIYEQMEALLKYCPPERYLVHADYGFGNALAKDGKITAVLDWALAMYGDFVYDIAWLDIGYPEVDYRSLFEEYYAAKNLSVPNYKERVLCYQCYISLDSQRWYGRAWKPDDYAWMKRRTLELLERGC